MKHTNSLFKGLSLFALLFITQISFGQNPTIINDSLIVKQRLYAKEKLFVDKDATFKMQISVAGASTLNGAVGMTNIGAASSVTTSSNFIIVQPDGQLKKGRVTDLMLAMSAVPIDLNYCAANGGVAQWWAGLNKLFTACPDVKVGIRTDDPQFPLHVVGSAYAQKFLAGNSGGTLTAIFNGFAQNNTDNLINLGVKIGGLSEVIRFSITNDGALNITNGGSDASVTINNGTGHAIVVKSNAGDKILQLQNDGLLRSRGVRVNLDTWADYVFKPGYRLESLEETETYIRSNGHLPGVPSEEQIIKEGLDLGEMQRIQMEKIEEMYLHMIELSQQVNDLKAKVSALEKENQQLKK